MTPTTPADYAKEVIKRAIESGQEYRRELRERLQGIAPHMHRLRGDDLVVSFNLAASQNRGIMVDPMTGEEKQVDLNKPQIDKATGQVTGYEPVDVPLGPNWVAALSHPNLHGGRELLAQMRANSKRAMEARYG